MSPAPEPPTAAQVDALFRALLEETGKLIVCLYEMPTADLKRLVEAAQLIDREGVEVLEHEHSQSSWLPSP